VAEILKRSAVCGRTRLPEKTFFIFKHFKKIDVLLQLKGVLCGLYMITERENIVFLA